MDANTAVWALTETLLTGVYEGRPQKKPIFLRPPSCPLLSACGVGLPLLLADVRI